MIYGIEQSTDSRARRTVIKKFTSVNAAKKWAEKSGDLTYGTNAEAARNYHRTFRRVYELQGRMISKKEINKRWEKDRGSIYCGTFLDIKASFIYLNGVEL